MSPAVLDKQRPGALALWLIYCVFCSCSGWILSAAHQLNPLGYILTFIFGAIVLLAFRRKLAPCGLRFRWPKLRWRFRHGLPLMFLVLAVFATLGGVIHPPSNFDGLTYRTPRVLHWLAEGRWHWIQTDFNRLNTRGCGFEWVTAPMIALMKTDRWLFIINVISFALLPGRVFSLLIRLGVKPRVAWHWMWLLPTGYGYLVQAGSISNDMFGAVIAMAAIEFALRARDTEDVVDLWLSGLAAALMTASKAFNLLLLLPLGIAALPSLRLLMRKPLATALIMCIAVTVSLVPTAVLNHFYSGDWTGMKAESIARIASGSAGVRFIANAVLLVINNFAPPVFPLANRWNNLMDHTIPPGIAERLTANFEPGGAHMYLDDMQVEEGAGLGFGVCVLLAIVAVRALFARNRPGCVAHPEGTVWRVHGWAVCAAMWVALTIWMTQSGLSGSARYLAPFYVVLVAPLLGSCGARNSIKSAWWKGACFGVFLLAGVLLIVSPARPLWPAQTILHAGSAAQSENPLIKRALRVYTVYAHRSDAFAPVVSMLPADADRLGFISKDDPETSLWRPFGSRRVLHVREADDPQSLRDRRIKYVLVSVAVVTHDYPMSLAEWIKRYDGELLFQTRLELRAGKAPSEWALVKLR